MSNEATASKQPTHTAYSVRDYQKNGERKSDWVAIGRAWRHRDGEGFDIVLDALPVNGRIALRTKKAKPAQA